MDKPVVNQHLQEPSHERVHNVLALGIRPFRNLLESIARLPFGNQDGVVGQFIDDSCLHLQAPTIKSDYSFGNNAYSIINIDSQERRFEILYRTYAPIRKLFVRGNEIVPKGVKYPTKVDQVFWDATRIETGASILETYRDQIDAIDVTNWYNVNFFNKSKIEIVFV